MSTTYAELEARDRVAAVEQTLAAIQAAKHEDPLPPLSSASETWLERLKAVACDPSVSAKSLDEMGAAGAAFVKGLDEKERSAFLAHLMPFLEIAHLMPADAADTRDYWEQVIVPWHEARGLEIPT